MPHCRIDVQGLTWDEGPAAPLPGGCLAYRPATGRRPPPRAQNAIKTNFIYIQVPTVRQEDGRGPASPQPDGKGTKL